jgi:DNA-binding GntR family transcriptional regulator
MCTLRRVPHLALARSSRNDSSGETVASRIHQAVKEDIIAGRHAAGARITEQQLAVRFRTSRTPVREAMRQLAAEGFIVFKPNSGSLVRQWTPEQVREVFDLRVIVESEVAGYAATRITPDEVGELERLQDAIEQRGPDTRAANMARIARLNREFHAMLGRASRNERLLTMLGSAIEASIVQQTFRSYTAQQLARSFSHHRELIDAFRCADAAWARSVMACHIHAARQARLAPEAP